MSTLIEKLLAESPKTFASSKKDMEKMLRTLASSIKSDDYEKASETARILAANLDSHVRNSRAANNKPDAKIAGYIAKAVKYLKDNQSDEKYVLEVQAATSEDEIASVIWDLASEIGDDKGWGSEGVGQEYSDMLKAIDPELYDSLD